MRTWTYTYKTSDGLRHEGEISASSKDEVYAALRQQGIRAIRVDERITPVVRKGFKGLRKRDWLVIVGGLAAVLLITVIMFLRWENSKGANVNKIVQTDVRTVGGAKLSAPHALIESKPVEIPHGVRVARPRPRHCVEGITELDLSSIFAHPSEAYFARFAEPGRAVSPLPIMTEAVKEDFFDFSDSPIMIELNDSRAVAELKRIVAGIKEEALERIAAGNDMEDIASWLCERARMEADYRKRIIERVSSGESRVDANRALATMGMAPID